MATNITDLPYNTKTVELPPRDIPRSTQEHALDPQVTQNYTPPKQPEYIEHQTVQPTVSKMDRFLDEFKLPIMIGILYILFDLPVSQGMLTKIAPSVFMDSNTGILARGVCFGLLFYASIMLSDYMSKP